jgi:predicted hydrolase (HD superfamily)
MENKGGIKKAFGFLILVIAISVVGIELVMSIVKSYGSQMESRHIKFRATKRINNTSDGELPLFKKIVQMDIKGMISANDIALRVFRRKAERDLSATRPAAAPQTGTSQTGTSGGGGQDAAAGDPTLGGGGDSGSSSGGGESVGDPSLNNSGASAGDASSSDATASEAAPAAASNISEALKKEITTSFVKIYTPNADDKAKFESIVNALASEDAAKVLKMFIQDKVSIETLLKLEADFYTSAVKLFAKIDKKHQLSFIKTVDYEYTEYKKEGIDKFIEIMSYLETDENVKKAGLSLKNSTTFNTYSAIFGIDEDSIRAAIKYLIKKEEDRQEKMRYLNKPIYKLSLWIVTAIYILACVMFILKSDIARVFVMFFGIVKIAYLLTVPISVLSFVVGLIVLLSIAAIALSFVSMYIVELRPKKA